MTDRNGAAEPQHAEEPAGEGRGPAGRRPDPLSSLDPVAAYERRTTRIRDEIARNRRGEYTVPTWVLAVALAAVVGLWLLVLFVL
ncbi:hypothetical protein [Glycomyces algeriensis]|uniref:Uncharacterized protein n=1 Tax=Glycomyces algeriensis TaxID=256037 RepID=A0A9W6GBB7_9ACTN|nr:hypothetical protein [Glycomyces algeriensis]MDA1367296.1 hypothetical protein [Glycomyces algeriensis]MDR7351052.1 hypothetical protein [Glycomyces algeriensis]GLI43765.1 hypothetical protein GALLR39Z86_36150 [Glycomyces algeriensis]